MKSSKTPNDNSKLILAGQKQRKPPRGMFVDMEDLKNFRQSRATTILNDYKRQYDQAQETENKVRNSFNQQYNLAQGQDQGMSHHNVHHQYQLYTRLH